ncbi:Biotin synthase [anaerobic digester metagenome]|nr:methylornithine synthase PylB [Methanomassiliicoccales archaeon]
MNPQAISIPHAMEKDRFDLEEVLGRAVDGVVPSFHESLHLLGLKEPDEINDLFESADHVRRKHFSDEIFMYGFVYFSTYCRNRCAFCFYNHDNSISPRYRKSTEEVLSLSTTLAESGVHLIDLTMGEDPYFHGSRGWRRLVDLVNMVKEEVDLPIMVSPGVLPDKVLRDLSTAGADWYACYQETHNRELFKYLRVDQDFDVRLGQRISAGKFGLLAEDGLLLNIGESLWDRAYAIYQMHLHGMQQVRAMTFVPQAGTPMSNVADMGADDELKVIAVMRLVCQDRLIPASLDIEGPSGLASRINAGANVVTSIIPPEVGLAGVAQHELDIDNGGRCARSVRSKLESMGLQAAPLSRYNKFIETYRGSKRMG